MRTKTILLGATAMAFLPTYALAAPGGRNNTSNAQPQTPVAQGQPNESCQDVNGGDTGPYYPGNTSTAPGSAFNETNGKAGSMYAGSQPQNSNNPASVSQYDVACFNQLIH